MARGINKAIIVGALGKDPEIRYTASGSAVASFSVATNEQWKDKQTGEKKERTEWHNITVFGKLAEICGEYLKKGSQVYLEGKIQTDKWQDQNGQDRYTTKIIANEMQMLGGNPGGQASQTNHQQRPQQGQQGQTGGNMDGFDDAIPFKEYGSCLPW